MSDKDTRRRACLAVGSVLNFLYRFGPNVEMIKIAISRYCSNAGDTLHGKQETLLLSDADQKQNDCSHLFLLLHTFGTTVGIYEPPLAKD